MGRFLKLIILLKVYHIGRGLGIPPHDWGVSKRVVRWLIDFGIAKINILLTPRPFVLT